MYGVHNTLFISALHYIRYNRDLSCYVSQSFNHWILAPHDSTHIFPWHLLKMCPPQIPLGEGTLPWLQLRHAINLHKVFLLLCSWHVSAIIIINILSVTDLVSSPYHFIFLSILTTTHVRHCVVQSWSGWSWQPQECQQLRAPMLLCMDAMGDFLLSASSLSS